MISKVGPEGEVILSDEIRHRLGIGPDWIAIQRIVGNHVEIFFAPPEHDRSLASSLYHETDVRLSTQEEWEQARDQAWEAAAREKEEGFWKQIQK